MKLLKNQYDDITKILAREGYTIDDYSLIKKKGRIRIHIQRETAFFSFFRRKKVSLTDHQEWLKSEHYEVNTMGKMSIAEDWQAVMQAFQSWVATLK